MLPTWYKIGSLVWLIAAPAFWWFAAAFNGLPFFSWPVLAGPSQGAGWQISLAAQLVIFGLLLFPITSLPFAVQSMRRSKENSDAPNN